MANNFGQITKYLTKAVDTVFATESKTALLENGQKYIDVSFEQAGYVRILDILMDGLSDYHRANSNKATNGYTNYNGVGHNDGYAVGDATAKWVVYPLAYDRGKQFQIDNMDNEENAGLIIANLLSEFLRTKVVPEVDAVRFSKIAGTAYSSLGNLVTETPTTTKGDANEILHLWNKGFEWLTEHEVPEEEQVIFVSPSTWTTLNNTEELYKKLTQEEYRSEMGVKFNFPAYNGRPIIVVPSDRFYNKIDVGSNGYAPATDSKVINYMIVSKKAIVPVVKLQKSKIFGPDAVQDFDGYKVNFRLYHDVIIPKNKITGCYVSLSAVAATTKSSVLNVALSKVSTGYTLDAFFTMPAGMNGTIIHNSTAFTLGATASSAQLGKAIAVGDTFTATTTSATTEYFALVDRSNKIIAVSSAVTLPTASE